MNLEDKNKHIKQSDIRPVMQNRRKRLDSGFVGQFLFYLICLIFICVYIYRGEIKEYFTRLLNKDSQTARWEFNLPFNSKRQNILLMGVDVSENPDKPFENTRSDAIYLISLSPHAKNVNVISIPRDSKVYIHSRSNPDKINHAFAFGGIDASVKTIEETLGVRIDHYIVVSNLALINFIDKIGGVDVYVEKDMHYDDYSAGLHIGLTKGMRHLNGKEAEGFMRYRKDGLGDIGRIRRQQWFLNALANKMKEPSVVIKIPDAIKSVSKYIQTDFSFYELAQYAALIKSVDMSAIRVATLPGEPSRRGFISYWILDPKGVQDIVNTLVYGDKPKETGRQVEAGILYTPDNKETADNLKAALEEKGVSVSLRQAKYLGHDHIAIHNFDLSSDTITSLKNEIPELKNKQTVYDIIGINKAAKDFTIVLAGS